MTEFACGAEEYDDVTCYVRTVEAADDSYVAIVAFADSHDVRSSYYVRNLDAAGLAALERDIEAAVDVADTKSTVAVWAAMQGDKAMAKRHVLTTKQRGYGYEHQLLRRKIARIVNEGRAVCSRCGEFIIPGSPWDLDHFDTDSSIPRTFASDL